MVVVVVRVVVMMVMVFGDSSYSNSCGSYGSCGGGDGIWRTRSSDHLCLSLPPVSTKLKFADRSFRHSSPRLWNSLPINLRSFAPDTQTTPPQSPALLLPTLAEHSLFLVISFFHALKPTSSLFPTLHNFSAFSCLPAIFPTGQF